MEAGRVLGVPKGRLSHPERKDVPFHCLTKTTSLFHWEYMSRCLRSNPAYSHDSPPRIYVTRRGEVLELLSAPVPPTDPEDDHGQIDWTPPDLSLGSVWYTKRLNNLFRAAAKYPGKELDIVLDGLKCLVEHRLNLTGRSPDLSGSEFCGGNSCQNIGMPYKMGAG